MMSPCSSADEMLIARKEAIAAENSAATEGLV